MKGHVRAPVLGASRVAFAAAIYPKGLAGVLVSGIELQCIKGFKTFQEVLMAVDGLILGLPGVTQAKNFAFEDEMVLDDDAVPRASAGVLLAVKLGEATAHRDNQGSSAFRSPSRSGGRR